MSNPFDAPEPELRELASETYLAALGLVTVLKQKVQELDMLEVALTKVLGLQPDTVAPPPLPTADAVTDRMWDLRDGSASAVLASMLAAGGLTVEEPGL